jgi:hypothetical protein
MVMPMQTVSNDPHWHERKLKKKVLKTGEMGITFSGIFSNLLAGYLTQLCNVQLSMNR